MTLEEKLNQNIIGQEPVLKQISSLLRRGMSGFRYSDEPIASVCALGSTGIGKTESSIIACDYLFGIKHLARFDMSEYNTHDGLKKMLGGEGKSIFEVLYDETEHKGLILFDEIEKAHVLVLDVLLQMLRSGKVTVSGGRVLDLRNYVVWCTSNIGSLELMDSMTIREDIISRRVTNAALEHLRPEIVNRFNLLAAFNKLGDNSMLEITQLHVGKCLDIARGMGHQVTMEDKCVKFIRKLGYSESFGASPIKREAMRIIGDSILEKQNGSDTPVSGVIDYDFTTGRYGIWN